MTRRSTATAALGLALALLALMPGVAAARAPITFNWDSYDPGCITGWAPVNNSLKLVWRDSTGTLKVKQEGIPVGQYGYWSYCAPGPVALEPHDSLKAKSGSIVRTFNVPPLTLVVDRVANDFHGTARPNTKVTLYYRLGMFADYYEQVKVPVDASGHWSFSEPSDPEYTFDIDGDADASLGWKSGNGDTLMVYAAAVWMRVTIGSSKVAGYAPDGLQANIALRDGDTNAKLARASTRGGDYFKSRFFDSSGQRVPVNVGDRVVGKALAEDLDWYVPDSGATANVATDVVTGFCEDRGLLSRTVIVRIFRTGHPRGFAVAYTKASGEFEISFRGREGLGFNPANIKHGDRIEVNCILTTGDWVLQSFRVP